MVPFLITCACCTLQLRFWSKITPKYLVLTEGFTTLAGSCRGGLLFGLCLYVKSIRASLEYSSGELWVVDHSAMLPSLPIISANLICASSSVAATWLESGPQAGAGHFCKSADQADLSHQLALSHDCKSTQTTHPLASAASEFLLLACILSMPWSVPTPALAPFDPSLAHIHPSHHWRPLSPKDMPHKNDNDKAKTTSPSPVAECPSLPLSLPFNLYPDQSPS